MFHDLFSGVSRLLAAGDRFFPSPRGFLSDLGTKRPGFVPSVAWNYHSGMDEVVFMPGARAMPGLEYAPIESMP